MKRLFLRGLIACAAAVLPLGAAQADSIDGNWCSPEGKTLSIKGREIVTPGGVKTQGDYSRHAFTYPLSPGEGAEGAKMLLQLVNEQTVHARVDGVSGPMVVWKRCEQTS